MVSFPVVTVREDSDESNPKKEGLILDYSSRVESREQELEVAGQIPSGVRNREQNILQLPFREYTPWSRSGNGPTYSSFLHQQHAERPSSRSF